VSLTDRFLQKVTVRDDGCWEWTGARDRKGYGRFRVGRRMHPAHRVAYELFKGPIPEGLTVDHTCQN